MQGGFDQAGAAQPASSTNRSDGGAAQPEPQPTASTDADTGTSADQAGPAARTDFFRVDKVFAWQEKVYSKAELVVAQVGGWQAATLKTRRCRVS
jgi:hypothetical protein